MHTTAARLARGFDLVFGAHDTKINTPHARLLFISIVQEHDTLGRASTQPHAAIAAGMLALVHFEGFGITVNETAGVGWAKKSINKLMLDQVAQNSDLIDGNFDLCGHAQFVLGRMYKAGCGVAQNPEKAVQLFKSAVSKNVRFALSVLGVMMVFGSGTPLDNACASNLFQRGAELGDAYATRNLGWMILHGFGQEKNEKLAIQIFERAADSGQVEALVNLGFTQPQVSDSSFRLSKIECYERAAEHGLAIAMYNLARMHLDPNHPIRDTERGLALLTKSAQQNQPWALLELGRICMHESVWADHDISNYIALDMKRGLEYVKHAAARGHAPATRLLQAKGMGTTNDS